MEHHCVHYSTHQGKDFCLYFLEQEDCLSLQLHNVLSQYKQTHVTRVCFKVQKYRDIVTLHEHAGESIDVLDISI